MKSYVERMMGMIHDPEFHSEQAKIYEHLARQYQQTHGKLFEHFYALHRYHRLQLITCQDKGSDHIASSIDKE